MRRPQRRRAIGVALAGGVLAAWLLYARAPEGAYRYFSYDTYEDPDLGDMSYALYLPPGYRGRPSWPLVVFLHGPGQRGQDGRRQLTEGLGPVIAARLRSGQPVDFIALFPQSLTGNWHPSSEDGRLVMKVVAGVRERYPVDPARVYLTGISDGASGVWSLAASYPREWAAIVPVAGRPGFVSAASIKDIPCWCFHGGSDTTVEPSEVRKMLDDVRRAGGEPRYTEYRGRGHRIWLAPYADPRLFEWLLAQRRPDSGD